LSFYENDGTLVSGVSSFFPTQSEITLQDVFDLTGAPGTVASTLTDFNGMALDLTVRENTAEPGSYVVTIPVNGGGDTSIATPITGADLVTLTQLDNPGDISGTVIGSVGSSNAPTAMGGFGDGTIGVQTMVAGHDNANIFEISSDGTVTSGGLGDGSLNRQVLTVW